MIFLFKDNTYDDKYSRITAESEKEAIIKALTIMVNNNHIPVSEVCDTMDLELIDVNNLKEYE